MKGWTMLETIGKGAILIFSILLSVACASAQEGNAKTDYSSALQINSSPQGAVIELTGQYTFVGRTPFIVPYQLYGKYRIRASKEGYESKTARVNLVKQGFNTVTIKLSRKTRAKAALRSALFPGWGQFYGQNKTRGFLVSAFQLTLGAVAAFAVTDYNNKKNDYDQALANFDQNQLNQEEAQIAFEQLQREFRRADDALNFRNTALYLTAGFWLYNIFDSLLFFSSGKATISITGNRTPALSRGALNNNQLNLTLQVRL